MPQDSVEKLLTYHYSDGSPSALMPADMGTWSLEGLAHAATITTHYLAEGKVRRRAPYSDKFQIFIGPPRSGSWVADFFVQFQSPATWAGVAAGLTVGIPTLAFNLLKRVGQRATGVATANDESKQVEETHPGTFDALVEAAEPSLVRAHRVITDEQRALHLSLGSFSFDFNSRTRRYIETSDLDGQQYRMRGNISAYNVNNRTGRAYFDELGRTIPFLINKNIGTKGEVAIAESLRGYASVRLSNGDIDIVFRAWRSPDGEMKRIVIDDAHFRFG